MDKKVAYIESIKGTNYRNYDFFQLVFSKKINFITGKNGEGKTKKGNQDPLEEEVKQEK